MIKEITSKENRIYKECIRLSQKKYRDKEGKYLIEGPNLVLEAIDNGVVIDYIIISRSKEYNIKSEAATYIMDSHLFDKISQTENSQGIIAVVNKGEFSVDNLMEINNPLSNVVVLDRLQDPGNIGTIIRTANGAGYDAVIKIKGTADVFSPKVIRAAAGSVFRIPIVQVEDDREMRELATKLGKRLVVTCFNTDNYYYDVDLTKGIALVIGNEGNGVCQELIDKSDVKVKIPMYGNLESLNASVAAGILMYEAVRGTEREN